ncbi:hypothetical protein GPJ56_003474 [Histomonas meleagridis]|uniref:uncharacterized protein n=1 Tax=Histomonas meleagridis TaxID=135588 RepID=UPI00355A0FBF|nr:hypothetical protein GPJ56_003474 [Histomonas meleagridis]KAH0799166.1 hypothetical protein GO595_007963 [Histomonas meleagridis]
MNSWPTSTTSTFGISNNRPKEANIESPNKNQNVSNASSAQVKSQPPQQTSASSTTISTSSATTPISTAQSSSNSASKAVTAPANASSQTPNIASQDKAKETTDSKKEDNKETKEEDDKKGKVTISTQTEERVVEERALLTVYQNSFLMPQIFEISKYPTFNMKERPELMPVIYYSGFVPSNQQKI